MNAHLTLLSENATVLNLVRDYAKGLGCTIDAASSSSGHGLGTELPDAGDTLRELLEYVALSATKAGVDLTEPLCRVKYWHPGALAEVTLGVRVVEFSLAKTGSAAG
jgi:hypothetical protein